MTCNLWLVGGIMLSFRNISRAMGGWQWWVSLGVWGLDCQDPQQDYSRKLQPGSADQWLSRWDYPVSFYCYFYMRHMGGDMDSALYLESCIKAEPSSTYMNSNLPDKQILSVLSIIVIILGIASINQWYKHCLRAWVTGWIRHRAIRCHSCTHEPPTLLWLIMVRG